MIPTGIAQYQNVQISMNSPGEILIALFDGTFKFLNVARHCLRNGDRARAGQSMSRAYAIIAELLATLDHRHLPDLCANLTNVYTFCLDRITQANVKNDATALDDVVKVLGPIREAFTTAVRSLPAQKLEATGSTG
jgi:flagellar protein FliS